MFISCLKCLVSVPLLHNINIQSNVLQVVIEDGEGKAHLENSTVLLHSDVMKVESGTRFCSEVMNLICWSNENCTTHNTLTAATAWRVIWAPGKIKIVRFYILLQCLLDFLSAMSVRVHLSNTYLTLIDCKQSKPDLEERSFIEMADEPEHARWTPLAECLQASEATSVYLRSVTSPAVIPLRKLWNECKDFVFSSKWQEFGLQAMPFTVKLQLEIGLWHWY